MIISNLFVLEPRLFIQVGKRAPKQCWQVPRIQVGPASFQFTMRLIEDDDDEEKKKTRMIEHQLYVVFGISIYA